MFFLLFFVCLFWLFFLSRLCAKAFLSAYQFLGRLCEKLTISYMTMRWSFTFWSALRDWAYDLRISLDMPLVCQSMYLQPTYTSRLCTGKRKLVISIVVLVLPPIWEELGTVEWNIFTVFHCHESKRDWATCHSDSTQAFTLPLRGIKQQSKLTGRELNPRV